MHYSPGPCDCVSCSPRVWNIYPIHDLSAHATNFRISIVSQMGIQEALPLDFHIICAPQTRTVLPLGGSELTRLGATFVLCLV